MCVRLIFFISSQFVSYKSLKETYFYSYLLYILICSIILIMLNSFFALREEENIFQEYNTIK